MGIRVVLPGEGERIDMGPVSMRIVEDGSHTGHRIGLIEETLLPGQAGPQEHVHHEHDEVFIVIAGKVRFTSGDAHFDAEPGTVVIVPIGVSHSFSNPFEQTAIFIASLTPDRYIQYFRELTRLPLNDQGFLDPADIARTMSNYATEVVH